MNDQPTPPEDAADVLPLDPAMRDRVRTALRHVEPQDVEQARAALDAALASIATRNRRRGMWLAVAAAGVVGVLSVAGIRGLGTSEPDIGAVELRMAEASESTLTDPAIEQFRQDILDSSPVTSAQCPIQGDQRSHGVRPWQGLNVEILVDRTTGVFQVLDTSTCSVLLVAPLTP